MRTTAPRSSAVRLVILVALAGVGLVLIRPTPATAGPLFEVVNADAGMAWRSQPDWNTSISTPGTGVRNGAQIELTCWQRGTGVPAATDNRLWYYARYINGGGSGQGGEGYINDHYIWTNVQQVGAAVPGVPQCGVPPTTATTSPPPTTSPSSTTTTTPRLPTPTVVNADGGMGWRSAPNWSLIAPNLGSGVANGDQLRLVCWARGTAVPASDNTLWYDALVISGRGSGEGFLNDHYIWTGVSQVGGTVPGVPQCHLATPTPTTPPNGTEPTTPTSPPPTTSSTLQIKATVSDFALSSDPARAGYVQLNVSILQADGKPAAGAKLRKTRGGVITQLRSNSQGQLTIVETVAPGWASMIGIHATFGVATASRDVALYTLKDGPVCRLDGKPETLNALRAILDQIGVPPLKPVFDGWIKALGFATNAIPSRYTTTLSGYTYIGTGLSGLYELRVVVLDHRNTGLSTTSDLYSRKGALLRPLTGGGLAPLQEWARKMRCGPLA